MFPSAAKAHDLANDNVTSLKWLQNQSFPEQYAGTKSEHCQSVNQDTSTQIERCIGNVDENAERMVIVCSVGHDETEQPFEIPRTTKKKKRKEKHKKIDKKDYSGTCASNHELDSRKRKRLRDKQKKRKHSPTSEDGRRKTQSHDKPLRRAHTNDSSTHSLSSAQKKDRNDESFNLNMNGKTVWIEDVGPKASDVYCIDTNANKNNLCFESLHFSEAALYRRLGQSCLGLSDRQLISWYSNKENKKNKISKIDRGRYFSKEAVKAWHHKIELIDLSRRRIGGSDTSMNKSNSIAIGYISLDTDFQSLSSSKLDSGFNSNEVDPMMIHDVATQHYIHGKASAHLPEQNKTQEIEDPWEGYVTKQTTEYNQKLRENPNDVKLWMNFVAFQDELASHGHSVYFTGESDDNRKKMSRLVTEKKIAILERAIKYNPSTLELKLEHAELCSQFWDSKQAKEHWDKLIFQHPNDPLLWQSYLMFIQSQFSSFTFSRVVSAYGKCIGKLSSIQDGQVATHKPLPNTENYLLDIFAQLCEFLRQSGYTEKAVCAYQAMLEFNLFSSQELDKSTPCSGQIAFLETFWDSDEPKFGEKDACGWNTWMHMKQKGGWQNVLSESDLIDDSDDIDDENIPTCLTDNFQVWLFVETAREQRQFLPWKPDRANSTTENNCEDPECMVVFDDVSSFLFKIKSCELRFKLLLYFLRFLGVTVPPDGSSSDYDLLRHSLYALEHPDQIFYRPKDDQELLTTLPYNHIQNQQLSVGVINNCTPLKSWLPSSLGDVKAPIRFVHPLKRFVRSVFAQSLPLFSDSNRTILLLLWIEFEFKQVDCIEINDRKARAKVLKQRCKEVRKFAKCILKEEMNRNNLQLWEAYATLEWKLGNTEESRRVFGTALAMSGQVSAGVQVNMQAIPSLVLTYVTLELGLDTDMQRFVELAKDSAVSKDCEGIQRLLKVLTWLGQGSKTVSCSQIETHTTTAPEILKSRKGFQSKLETVLEMYKTVCVRTEDTSETLDGINYPVEYICCYAWFQYLTVSLKSATIVYEAALTCLSACVANTVAETYLDATKIKIHKHYENVFLNYITLIIYHVRRNPTPLVMLRSILQRALNEFPRSVIFLQLFIAMEMKSHIIGRVRRFFDHTLHVAASPVTWLCSIKAELIREELMTRSRMESLDQSTQSTVRTTGLTHRVFSLFEKATTERVARHCVLIWRMFIQFEVSYGNLKRAKSLFYQALQHCPWAKVLYLDAVRYFPDELDNVLDILMEKELHIRAPLEEVELLMKTR